MLVLSRKLGERILIPQFEMFRIIALSLAVGLVTSRPVKAGPVVSYSTSGTFDVNSTTGSTIELNKGNFTIELFFTGTRQNGFCVLHHGSDSEYQRNDDQRARTVLSDSRKRWGRNGTGLWWLA